MYLLNKEIIVFVSTLNICIHNCVDSMRYAVEKLKDKNKITYNLKYDEDLVVSGLGFVKIVDKGTINIYIDKDVDTFVRKSLI